MQAIETYQPRLRNISRVTSIQEGRQYKVVGGYAVYGSGTFTDGQKFYGNSTDSTILVYGGQVDQQGAFILSFPGHIGKPALLPLGLFYDNHNIRQANSTARQSPIITVCQPWMIEAGIYVAHPDFWSPETVTTGLEIVAPAPDRYPDTENMVIGFREGDLETVVLEMSAATSIIINNGSMATVVLSGDGGTHSGTMSVSIGDGSISDTVFSGTGTNFGTMSVSIWDGSLATVVFIGDGGTYSGTTSVFIGSGSLVTASISGGSYLEDGTMLIGFLGGAYV
jgi:hypothetical protein